MTLSPLSSSHLDGFGSFSIEESTSITSISRVALSILIDVGACYLTALSYTQLSWFTFSFASAGIHLAVGMTASCFLDLDKKNKLAKMVISAVCVSSLFFCTFHFLSTILFFQYLDLLIATTHFMMSAYTMGFIVLEEDKDDSDFSFLKLDSLKAEEWIKPSSLPFQNFGHTCFVNAAMKILFHHPEFLAVLEDPDVFDRLKGEGSDEEKKKENLEDKKHLLQKLLEIKQGIAEANGAQINQALKAIRFENRLITTLFTEAKVEGDAGELIFAICSCLEMSSNKKMAFFSTTKKFTDEKELVREDRDPSYALSIKISASDPTIKKALIEHQLNKEVEFPFFVGEERKKVTEEQAKLSHPDLKELNAIFVQIERAQISGTKDLVSVKDVLEEQTIDFFDEATSMEKRVTLEPIGIIGHLGKEIASAHYVSYLKNKEAWFCHNDSSIQFEKEAEAFQAKAEKEVSLVLYQVKHIVPIGVSV